VAIRDYSSSEESSSEHSDDSLSDNDNENDNKAIEPITKDLAYISQLSKFYDYRGNVSELSDLCQVPKPISTPSVPDLIQEEESSDSDVNGDENDDSDNEYLKYMNEEDSMASEDDDIDQVINSPNSNSKSQRVLKKKKRKRVVKSENEKFQIFDPHALLSPLCGYLEAGGEGVSGDVVVLGSVSGVLENEGGDQVDLVMVESRRDLYPIQRHSIITLENKLPVGRVYDIIGPIDHPFYLCYIPSLINENEKEDETKEEVQNEKKDHLEYYQKNIRPHIEVGKKLFYSLENSTSECETLCSLIFSFVYFEK